MTLLESQIDPRSIAQQAHAQHRWLQVLTDLHPRYGGVSAAVPQLSCALGSTGVDAPIAALCAASEQYQPFGPMCGEVQFLPRARSEWMLGTAARDALQAAVREADGVHVHGLWTQATLSAWQLAEREGKPLCVSAHGMLEPWALRQHQLKKRIYAALVEHRVLRGAACLQALTTSEARSYRKIAPRVPVVVIPNGVTVPRTLSSRSFFQSFPELRGKRIVLFLGRLHAKKGADLLLQAWRCVNESVSDAHLVIAGADDGMGSWLQAYLTENDLWRSVSLTGMLDAQRKWSALSAAECFVLPSHSEGLSVAILEALGAGTPVLATPQCNMPEIAEENCGWLVQPNVPSLRDGLMAVLQQSPSQNAAVGQRGCSLVQRRYTWPSIAGRLASVYGWLNGGSAPDDVEVLR